MSIFQTLKNMMGIGPEVDYKELVKNGAVVIDVRTPAEFNSGHIKGSLNIPVQSLQKNTGKLQKDKPVITCCASGMRSASAKGILKSAGFSEVYNGGPWTSLNAKL